MTGRTATPSDLALCSGVALPEGDAPEWVQLLPAGPTVATVDGRGPYKVEDATALAAASLPAGARLPIDENHATDLAAPKGEPAPARGWIVALSARADGIWGQVEWTGAGKALLADRAYRFLSPVIRHLKDGRVTAILRAALVNTPNLRGVAALNSETTMDELLKALRTALGLGDDADQKAAIDAVTALRSQVATHAAALAPIARAAGLAETAEATAILSAVTTLAAGDKDKQIVALQAELTTVSTELKSLRDGIARGKAEAAVDAAITAGKPGVKPLRDHYIARHMADATSVDKELAGLPSLIAPTGAKPTPPAKAADGTIALNAEQLAAAKVLGIDPAKYAETLAAEATADEAAWADTAA